jgi:hypothetical protein
MAKYTEDVRTRLSEQELAGLRRAAEDEGAHPSEIVRKVIDQYAAGGADLSPGALEVVEKAVAGMVPAIREEVAEAVARREQEARGPLLDAIDGIARRPRCKTQQRCSAHRGELRAADG